MKSPSRIDQAWQKFERFQRLGAWALALGIVLFILAVMTLGVLPGMSPKSTTSVFVALQNDGHMRWLFIPVAAVSIALVILGLLLRTFARRHSDRR